jgi:peptidoglycan/xylan/chitin deacetylase (PgdA/CDA1 family)
MSQVRSVGIELLFALVFLHLGATIAQSAVPVLVYNQINIQSSQLSVSLAAFTRQMNLLVANGYQSISSAQYVSWLNGESQGLPPKPILITFDDNSASCTAATNVLKARNLRATMFVVSSFANSLSPQ